MITKTLGTSGADFTSIAAWVSWVQANAVSGGNLTDSVTLNCLAVGVSPSASDTVSGWAPGGSNFTTTISADSSNSANRNASVQSRAFFYNASNGAFIDYTGGSNRFLTLGVDLCTVSNLQFQFAGNYQSRGLYFSATNGIVDSVIIKSVAGGGSCGVGLTPSGVSKSLTVKNSLISNQTTANYFEGISAPWNYAHIKLYDNTLISVPGRYGRGIRVANSYDATISGNAFINFDVEVFGGASTTTGSNNATTNASASAKTPATNLQTSVALTDFQGGTLLTDFRLASGAAKLLNNGTTISGVTTDWAGTTRPQGASNDIGAWELVSASSAPSHRLLLLGAGMVAADLIERNPHMSRRDLLSLGTAMPSWEDQPISEPVSEPVSEPLGDPPHTHQQQDVE